MTTGLVGTGFTICRATQFPLYLKAEYLKLIQINTKHLLKTPSEIDKWTRDETKVLGLLFKRENCNILIHYVDGHPVGYLTGLVYEDHLTVHGLRLVDAQVGEVATKMINFLKIYYPTLGLYSVLHLRWDYGEIKFLIAHCAAKVLGGLLYPGDIPGTSEEEGFVGICYEPDLIGSTAELSVTTKNLAVLLTRLSVRVDHLTARTH